MPNLLDEHQVRELIAEGTRQVVETMFFTAVVEEDEVPVELGEPEEVAVHVAFRGTPSGRLAVRLTRTSAAALAAIFLGVDEQDLSEQQLQGVLGEMANMITGAVLSHVDSEALFDLDPPRPAPFVSGPPSATCSLPLECGWLHVTLWMK